MSEYKGKCFCGAVEAVLRVQDGLPKLKDFPKEFGGSGESLPE
jgi:hypothetical protein